MFYYSEQSERVIVFPPVNPAILPSIRITYRRMKMSRMYKMREEGHADEIRRCNRCGEFFHIEETVLRRYYHYSSRNYRLCIECSEFLEKNKKNKI